jgi:NADH dehydrogenase [ubiquinone] 1 alpha subcomplex assembly factor 7
MTTPLAREIATLIASEGPIGVDRYMALCLGHPHHGYYITRDPFGEAGDFVTAPEISQMFGELIGIWAASVWQMLGAQASVRLVELGPGRGTLMADLLRAAAALPEFVQACEVHLVETSPVLRESQMRTLAAMGVTPCFHDRIETALSGPCIVIGNEFLDALPIRQFQKSPEGWHERLIGCDGVGRLGFGLGEVTPLPGRDEAPVGTIIEHAEAALSVTRTLASHIAQYGGAALLIDYGALASGTGDTLQAVKRHAFVDPLAEPGEADLTVQVDFAAMSRAARKAGAAVHGPVTQADFLEAMGLRLRMDRLSKRATPAQLEAIEAAATRLADRAERGMGALFKVIAILPSGLPLVPGFDRIQFPEPA